MTIKAFIFVVSLSLLISGACSCTSALKKAKPKAEYIGVDVNAQPYVDEFMELSRRNNITFKRSVSIGFKQINQGKVIGLCTYAKSFREIDLDIGYWQRATEKERKALMFHELVHCYCERGHDFADKQDYPESFLKSIYISVGQNIPWCLKKLPGYFDDHCPLTIMHPTLTDRSCLETHWEHYLKEMFDRCEPF